MRIYFSTNPGQVHFSWREADLVVSLAFLRVALNMRGDYLFLVKGNQPHLLEDLRLLFAPAPAAKRAWESVLHKSAQEAHTTQKGHGRMDMRSIRASSELKGYSDWPGLEQDFEIRRRWLCKGIWREAVRYGVTSLPATIALPVRLLMFKGGHWIIEIALRQDESISLPHINADVITSRFKAEMAAF